MEPRSLGAFEGDETTTHVQQHSDSVSGQAHQAVEQKAKDLAGTLAEPSARGCNPLGNRTISKIGAEYLMQFFSGGRRLSDDAQWLIESSPN